MKKLKVEDQTDIQYWDESVQDFDTPACLQHCHIKIE
jgi:hypothetical protein